MQVFHKQRRTISRYANIMRLRCTSRMCIIQNVHYSKVRATALPRNMDKLCNAILVRHQVMPPTTCACGGSDFMPTYRNYLSLNAHGLAAARSLGSGSIAEGSNLRK